MSVFKIYDDFTTRLRASGEYTWPLLLRLILAWEFWEAGITKLRGGNWFEEIPWADWQKGFPFPFDLLSTNLNWTLATWAELVFAVMLTLGLASIWLEPVWGGCLLIAAALAMAIPAVRSKG